MVFFLFSQNLSISLYTEVLKDLRGAASRIKTRTTASIKNCTSKNRRQDKRKTIHVKCQNYLIRILINKSKQNCTKIIIQSLKSIGRF